MAHPRLPLVEPVEVGPTGVVSRWEAALKSIVDEEWRRRCAVREVWARCNCAQPPFALVRIGERRLQVAYTVIERRILPTAVRAR